jgi:hypothetical protein
MDLNKYDYNKLISNINTAHTEIKILEQEDMDLPIPAIKQLKDVSYHIVKALESQNNEAEFIKQMNRAETHAVRAKYDIYELRIMWYLENIKSYTKILTPIKETTEVISDYIDILTNVEKIKDTFEKNLNDEVTSRANYYSNIKEEIKNLKDIQLKLKTSLPIINKQYEERKYKEKQEDKKTIRNYIIGIFGILVAIAGILVTNN